jgi:hypothetical protein
MTTSPFEVAMAPTAGADCHAAESFGTVSRSACEQSIERYASMAATTHLMMKVLGKRDPRYRFPLDISYLVNDSFARNLKNFPE